MNWRILVPILAAVLAFSCQSPVKTVTDPLPEDWSSLTLTTAPSAATADSMKNPAGWERKNTAFYHVWVSAFADGPDADATGDLVGLNQKVLDGYFTDLGVNALWLSPVFKASSLTGSNKHGYDTISYDEVDSIYGTNTDLKTLLTSAHARGIRVIFDFVPNHTSNQNPWFTTRKDWYVTSPTKPAGWNGFGGGSDWYSYSGGGFYYGVFGGGMPDLNYRNGAVRNEMASVVARWLNFGFDGLRVDAVKYLAEGTSDTQWMDQPETYLWFQALRKSVLDPYTAQGSAKFMVAENWESNMANLKSYLVKDDKPAFSMTFDFDWPWWVANRISGSGTATEKADLTWALVDRPNFLPSGTTFGTFQTNHDNAADRPATAYAGTDQGPKLFLAAGLSLLGKGTPFVYYGNEIGMTGKSGNDMNLRQPFDWSREVTLKADTNSLWSWHSALLKLRTSSPAWDDPAIALLTSPSGTLAWLVTGTSGKRVVVVANLTSTLAASVAVSGLAGDLSLSKTVLGAGQPVVSSGTLTFDSLPAYGLRVAAVDEAAPLVVRNIDGDGSTYTPIPVVPPTLFLRGTMNSWGTTALLSSGAGVFHLSFTAGTSDTVLFKFGTPDWSVALGFADMAYDSTKGGMPSSAFTGVSDGFTGMNVQFTATAGTSYELFLNTTPTPPTFWVLGTP